MHLFRVAGLVCWKQEWDEVNPACNVVFSPRMLFVVWTAFAWLSFSYIEFANSPSTSHAVRGMGGTLGRPYTRPHMSLRNFVVTVFLQTICNPSFRLTGCSWHGRHTGWLCKAPRLCCAFYHPYRQPANPPSTSQVVRGMDGTLDGFAKPQHVSHHIQALLDKIAEVCAERA